MSKSMEVRTLYGSVMSSAGTYPAVVLSFLKVENCRGLRGELVVRE